MSFPVTSIGNSVAATGPEPVRRVSPDTAERPATPAAAAETPVDESILAAALERGAEVVSGSRTIEFTFDKDINRVVVRVKSADTGEVVRQIPPEEYMQFLARFKELFGVLFDRTA